jgi:hypothetical protein
MRHPSQSWIARGARGQVSWVTLFLLLVLGGGAYLAWVFVPAYLTHYEAKQVVRTYMNYAVKNRDDATLRQELVAKLRALQTVRVTAEDGSVVEVPAVDVAAQDVTWEREADARPPMLHVALQYDRTIVFPYLERQQHRIFVIDLTQDISIPTW